METDGYTFLCPQSYNNCHYTVFIKINNIIIVLSHVQLFATLWTVAHQAPLVHVIFQARILERVAISLLQGIFPTYGSNPCLIVSCIGRQILYHQHHLGGPKLRGSI